jgi:glutamate carboxypeptidase
MHQSTFNFQCDMRSLFLALPLSILGLVCMAGSGAGQLSDVERRMAEHVDAENPQAVALLERIVNINSGTMNFDGVREVGRILRGEFDALGFETEWVNGDLFGRAGHLVARQRGTGPHVLLIGHLDTVFELDSPFQHYQLANDTVARGPGVADMKGGDVIIIYALKALQAAGELEGRNITVVMTGDEESSGRPLDLARAALVEAAEAADIAMGFENGDNDASTGVIARRGFTGWELRVTGRPAHSSQIFRQDIGAGAIYEAARILADFYDDMAGEQYLTFSPGVILGGTSVEFDAPQSRGTAFGKTNVVAEQTVVAGDLRTISAEQRESAKQRMQAVVATHLPHTDASLTFVDTYPPLSPTEGNSRLLGELDRASRDLGLGAMTAVDPGAAGAADVSFTSGLVDMAIDGLGLTGGGDHTVEEYADLPVLPMQTKRAAVMIYRLTRRDGAIE